MGNGKRLTIEWIELPNQGRIRTVGEKQIHKYTGMSGAYTIEQKWRGKKN